MISFSEKQRHLDNLREAQEEFNAAKKSARYFAQQFVRDMTDSARNKRDLLAIAAVDLGIPKAQVRREGMGTTDSKTLEDVLKGQSAERNL